MIKVTFDNGTLVWSGDDIAALALEGAKYLKFDERTASFRSRACEYVFLMKIARAKALVIDDQASEFKALDELALQQTLIPRKHQQTAFDAWRNAGYRGVTALPTGSGKTILAVMAIARLKRPTLVLVPTIDLLAQWAGILEEFFQVPIGMWGGGSNTTCDITVSTYNSAVLKMEFYGNRFAFLIADECHHLPGEVNQQAAQWSLAPYRLGLSATPESDAVRDSVLTDLMGDIVCRVQIDELAGGVLADYDVETIPLTLTPAEQAEYMTSRKIYTDFLHQHHVVMNSIRAWRNFIMEVVRNGAAGRKAFQAYLKQKNIARSEVDWKLLSSVYERELAVKLYFYGAALRQAAERNDCSGLVEYLLELAKAFNRFYRECPVLAADNEALAAARLALASAVRQVIADGLNTLTIGVPEAM